jgi:hypothetical protein
MEMHTHQFDCSKMSSKEEWVNGIHVNAPCVTVSWCQEDSLDLGMKNFVLVEGTKVFMRKLILQQFSSLTSLDMKLFIKI